MKRRAVLVDAGRRWPRAAVALLLLATAGAVSACGQDNERTRLTLGSTKVDSSLVMDAAGDVVPLRDSPAPLTDSTTPRSDQRIGVRYTDAYGAERAPATAQVTTPVGQSAPRDAAPARGAGKAKGKTKNKDKGKGKGSTP
jgi:hypothetical protein